MSLGLNFHENTVGGGICLPPLHVFRFVSLGASRITKFIQEPRVTDTPAAHFGVRGCGWILSKSPLGQTNVVGVS